MAARTVLQEQLRLNQAQEVDLKGWTLSIDQVKELVEMFSKNQSITSLNLTNNHISTLDVGRISKSLTEISTLTCLKIRRNKLKNEDMFPLSKLLATSSLLTLNLNRNDIGDEGFGYLATALDTNTTLTDLTLYRNQLGEKAAKCLGEVLKTNKSLRILNVGCNHLGRCGTSYIADGLKSNSMLVYLDYRENNIGPDGAKYLASALKTNNTLEKLYVGRNLIRDEGALHFADCLCVNTRLRTLKLHDNGITNTGGKSIASALQKNESLTALSLKKNPLSNDSLRDLGLALMKNSSLAVLNLSDLHYTIHENGIGWLAKALKKNTSLTGLSLTDNNLDLKCISLLAESLKSNESLVTLRLPRILSGDMYERLHIYESITSKLSDNHKKVRRKFLEALNGDETTTWNRVRIMFVGQGKAGKSSTINSLLGKKFDPNWNSTIGAVISESESTASSWKECLNSSHQSTLFAAKIMIQKNNMPSSAKSKVLLDKIENKPWFQEKDNEANKPYKNTEQKKDNGTLASSEGSSNRFVNKEAFEELNDNWYDETENDTYDYNLLVDAKRDEDSLAFSLWDFGGQSVFYAMHHIFLTKSGIYVLVFDMREILNKTDESLKYVKFWLNSIQLHAPGAPAFLVGTFLESLAARGDIRKVNTILASIASEFPQVIRHTQTGDVFYSVDNKSGEGIAALRSEIEQVSRSTSSLSCEVSVRWMRFLDKLLAKRATENHLSLSQVCALGKELGIYQGHEVELALSLFHERGSLLHLTATELLRDVVVLNPQWLVDSLSKVIRDDTEHAFSLEEFRKAGLEFDLKMTFTEAITTRDFLEYVWKNTQVDFLIDLMKRTMLLSEWIYGNHDQQFLIPSLLKNNAEPDVEGISCIFDFSARSLPSGVFERVVCLLVAYTADKDRSTGGEPELYKNFAKIELQDSMLKLLENKDKQCLQVFVTDDRKSFKYYEIIQSMLCRVNYDVMNSGLQWETRFENPGNGKFISFADAKKVQLSPWFLQQNSAKPKGLKFESFISEM